MVIQANGYDTAHNTYSSVEEMWRLEAGMEGDGDEEMAEGEQGEQSRKPREKGKWYSEAIEYWSNVDATVDGVLGGYGRVSTMEIAESKQFLQQLYGKVMDTAAPGTLTVVDCGAGVGRITEQMLIYMFDEVDLAEPVTHFLDKAKENLQGKGPPECRGRARNFFYEPLQTYTPMKGHYDIIWVQWVLGHLTDIDFIAFFKRCAEGIKEGGYVCVKENVAENGFIVDRDDSSLTRSQRYYEKLFEQAVSTSIRSNQKKFPKDLFKVKMWALSPIPYTGNGSNTSQKNPAGTDFQKPSKKRPKNAPALLD